MSSACPTVCPVCPVCVPAPDGRTRAFGSRSCASKPINRVQKKFPTYCTGTSYTHCRPFQHARQARLHKDLCGRVKTPLPSFPSWRLSELSSPCCLRSSKSTRAARAWELQRVRLLFLRTLCAHNECHFLRCSTHWTSRVPSISPCYERVSLLWRRRPT